jgi:hypothetical protein
VYDPWDSTARKGKTAHEDPNQDEVQVLRRLVRTPRLLQAQVIGEPMRTTNDLFPPPKRIVVVEPKPELAQAHKDCGAPKHCGDLRCCGQLRHCGD